MEDGITNIAIEDYLAMLMPSRPPALAELEQLGYQRGIPLIGPVEGQLIALLAKLNGTKRVLEVGTMTGYAALWLLQAIVPAGGRMTAIQRPNEMYPLAQEYVERAGYADSFEVRTGEWLAELKQMTEQFDLIFLDILRLLPSDDEATIALELCLNLLRPGGLLITDNVLCNALVLEEDAAPTVRGIQLFNQAVMSHPDLESVIVPLRDGVAISRKASA